MLEKEKKHKTIYKVCVDYVGEIMTHEFYGTMSDPQKDDPHIYFSTSDGSMTFRTSDIVFMRKKNPD